jgi:hypothetical protein
MLKGRIREPAGRWTMSIIALLVAGFLSSFEAGGSCIDALHQLRTEERLEVVATEVLEDNVLAFTLSDGPRRAEKTAILICQRDVDGVDEDDPEIGDDIEPEVIEPSEAMGGAPDEPQDDTGGAIEPTEQEPVVE